MWHAVGQGLTRAQPAVSVGAGASGAAERWTVGVFAASARRATSAKTEIGRMDSSAALVGSKDERVRRERQSVGMKDEKAVVVVRWKGG